MSPKPMPKNTMNSQTIGGMARTMANKTVTASRTGSKRERRASMSGSPTSAPVTKAALIRASVHGSPRKICRKSASISVR